jgi:DNA-binding HxlR family transcriptional regulator
MYQNIKTTVNLKNCNPDDGLALLEILNIFSGKWKMLILGALHEGDIRFTEIKKLMPAITPRMLSKELKDLEMNGLVKRTVEDSRPVLIKYGLTESAKGLSEKILGLMEWGLEHRRINKANLRVS